MGNYQTKPSELCAKGLCGDGPTQDPGPQDPGFHTKRIYIPVIIYPWGHFNSAAASGIQVPQASSVIVMWVLVSPSVHEGYADRDPRAACVGLYLAVDTVDGLIREYFDERILKAAGRVEESEAEDDEIA